MAGPAFTVPVYGQAVFAIDRIKALAPDHPEWKTTKPYKAMFFNETKALAGFSEQDWEQIIGVTHAGMTVEGFQKVATAWTATAKDPHFDRLYVQLVYQPMLEVLRFLRDNEFRTYSVPPGRLRLFRAVSKTNQPVEKSRAIVKLGPVRGSISRFAQDFHAKWTAYGP